MTAKPKPALPQGLAAVDPRRAGSYLQLTTTNPIAFAEQQRLACNLLNRPHDFRRGPTGACVYLYPGGVGCGRVKEHGLHQ